MHWWPTFEWLFGDIVKLFHCRMFSLSHLWLVFICFYLKFCVSRIPFSCVIFICWYNMCFAFICFYLHVGLHLVYMLTRIHSFNGCRRRRSLLSLIAVPNTHPPFQGTFRFVFRSATFSDELLHWECPPVIPPQWFVIRFEGSVRPGAACVGAQIMAGDFQWKRLVD